MKMLKCNVKMYFLYYKILMFFLCYKDLKKKKILYWN